jgi:hypothetical protein
MLQRGCQRPRRRRGKNDPISSTPPNEPTTPKENVKNVAIISQERRRFLKTRTDTVPFFKEGGYPCS